jgi:hypothetical protein
MDILESIVFYSDSHAGRFHVEPQNFQVALSHHVSNN